MNHSGKKKVMKMLVGILIIAVVAAMAVLLYLKATADRHILDGPGMINDRSGNLVGVTYSEGGGMEGSSLYISIQPAEEHATYNFSYSYTPYHGAEEETFSCEIVEMSFVEIRRICMTTGCLISDEGVPNELAQMLLDAPTTHLTFMLDDGTLKSFHSNYDYPPECEGILSKVYTVLMNIYETHK